MINNKPSIRNEMKIKRKKFYSSNELSPWLAAKNFFLKFKSGFSCIAVYWPIIYELDTRPLIKGAIDNDISIALPIIENNQIVFKKWNKLDNLIFNSNKFYQPIQFDKNTIKPELVVVPLLAFDNLGYRIGYGKGFYDKYYEKNKDIKYIGYGFSFQRIEKLPVGKYDLKLNSVVTDNYSRDFN